MEAKEEREDNGTPFLAYLGPPSSYTHQAVVDNFDSQKYQLMYRSAIIDVFYAVQDGIAKYGVVPFENSSNGAVIQTLDIFGDKTGQFPDINVCGEAYIAVHHCLLGFASGGDDGDIESGEATPTTIEPSPAKSKAKPRKKVQHIRKIYSHPQAFGQCEAFLSVHLKGTERQEVSSTSRAAQIVSQDAEKTSAAISSRMAAEVHELDILAAGIEDRPDNETRFVVIRRAETEDPGLPGNGPGKEEWKTFVSFNINHNETGALSRVLNLFRDFGLNLTSINSRPSRTRPWHYTFFVEFEGQKSDNPDDQVSKALASLKEVTEGYKWHGSWKRRGGI